MNRHFRPFPFFKLFVLTLLVALPLAAQGKRETAVLAGGCFWGVDAVFKHVKGVAEVESGYAGGNASTATDTLCSVHGFISTLFWNQNCIGIRHTTRRSRSKSTGLNNAVKRTAINDEVF